MNKVLINLDKLNSNVNFIKKAIGSKCEFYAVIKGDAYGLGLIKIGLELSRNNNVSCLVVSSIEEALECMDAGITKNILMLNHVPVWHIREILEQKQENVRKKIFSQFIFSIYDLQEIPQMNELSSFYKDNISVHLRLDFIGAGRGISYDMFQNDKELYLKQWESLTIKGLYAHIYSAYCEDDKKDKTVIHEIEKYEAAISTLPENFIQKIKIHFLSSMSCFRFPQYRENAVRIGAALYGMPFRDELNEVISLKPIMSIKGKVVHVVKIREKSCIDYLGSLTEEPKTVAVLSIGNWDAPNLFLGDKTTVSINGNKFKVIGSACMDSCCVDITGHQEIKEGDEAWLLGDFEGIELTDKIFENNFKLSDCQMLFSGMNRLKHYYEKTGRHNE